LYRGQNGYAPHLDRDNDGIRLRVIQRFGLWCTHNPSPLLSNRQTAQCPGQSSATPFGKFVSRQIRPRVVCRSARNPPAPESFSSCKPRVETSWCRQCAAKLRLPPGRSPNARAVQEVCSVFVRSGTDHLPSTRRFPCPTQLLCVDQSESWLPPTPGPPGTPPDVGRISASRKKSWALDGSSAERIPSLEITAPLKHGKQPR